MQDPTTDRWPTVDSLGHELIRACADECAMDGAALVLDLGAGDSRTAWGRSVPTATDPTAQSAADLQFVVGAGPHPTAMADGAVHHLHEAPDRWSPLIAELTDVGVGTVYSVPLTADAGQGTMTVGTVQLHAADPDRGIDERALTAVRRLGTRVVEATIAASVQHRSVPVGGYDPDQVCRAVGVLMVRYRLSAAGAEALLRAKAFRRRLSSTDTARFILADVGGADPSP